MPTPDFCFLWEGGECDDSHNFYCLIMYLFVCVCFVYILLQVSRQSGAVFWVAGFAQFWANFRNPARWLFRLAASENRHQPAVLHELRSQAFGFLRFL